MPKCGVCNTNTLSKCIACGYAYCSKACQNADWKQHKQRCGLRSLSVKKLSRFLAWASDCACLDIRSMRFSLKPATYHAMEQRTSDGIIFIITADLIKLAVFDSVLYVDCALGAILFKQFKTRHKHVVCPWPMYTGLYPDMTAVMTTLTQDDDCILRTGPRRCDFSLVWICEMGEHEYWGMMSSGIQVGPKRAFGSRLENMHQNLKKSVDVAEQILLQEHYVHGIADKEFLRIHASIVHCVAMKHKPLIEAVYK